MNEVHCISDILEHASVGHEQVAVLVTVLEAGESGDVCLINNSVVIIIII